MVQSSMILTALNSCAGLTDEDMEKQVKVAEAKVYDQDTTWWGLLEWAEDCKAAHHTESQVLVQALYIALHC